MPITGPMVYVLLDPARRLAGLFASYSLAMQGTQETVAWMPAGADHDIEQYEVVLGYDKTKDIDAPWMLIQYAVTNRKIDEDRRFPQAVDDRALVRYLVDELVPKSIYQRTLDTPQAILTTRRPEQSDDDVDDDFDRPVRHRQQAPELPTETDEAILTIVRERLDREYIGVGGRGSRQMHIALVKDNGGETLCRRPIVVGKNLTGAAECVSCKRRYLAVQEDYIVQETNKSPKVSKWRMATTMLSLNTRVGTVVEEMVEGAVVRGVVVRNGHTLLVVEEPAVGVGEPPRNMVERTFMWTTAHAQYDRNSDHTYTFIGLALAILGGVEHSTAFYEVTK